MQRILTALFLAAVACLAASPADASKKDDTLVWASDRENSITDSNYLNTRELVIIGSLLYDRLIHLDDKYQPQPLLASGWTWVDDTTLDLDIRKGVKFHSGKDLDADDVVYTISFLIDRNNAALSYSYVSHIKSVEKRDSHKVRLNFNKPFPTALVFLAGVPNIMAKGHYDNAPNRADGKKDFGAVTANGTGPFRLTEVKPGESILMTANAEYWQGSPKGKPQIGKIRFRTIKDANARLAEVMTGAVDWVWDVPKDQAERMGNAPNLVVENAKTLRIAYVNFDAAGVSQQKAFKDKRVRQAIAHAINREAIVKNLVGEPSEVIHAACHPDQFACADDVPKYDYNPQKARKLLAEAGYADGFEFELHSYREREHAEAIIGDLVKVGLKPKLVFLQYAPLMQAIHKGQVAATHMTWGSSSIPDVSACAAHFFKGTPDDMAKDPEVIRLIGEADGTVDPAKRQRLWRQALTRIAEEAYWVPLFSYAKYYVYAKDLDFKATSDEIPQFYRAKWK